MLTNKPSDKHNTHHSPTDKGKLVIYLTGLSVVVPSKLSRPIVGPGEGGVVARRER